MKSGTWTRAIPAYRRDGTIRAFVMVDALDYERFAGLRWVIRSVESPYAARWDNGAKCWSYLHREILGIPRGDRRRTDHVNRDPLDNRRVNLRIATDAQNAQNQGSRGGSSQHRGVTWDKARQKWLAAAMLKGKRHHIGRFDSEDEAAEAAAEWRARHMPYSQEARS